jgi:hypothetical protein
VVTARALAVVESWSENPNIEILGNPMAFTDSDHRDHVHISFDH